MFSDSRLILKLWLKNPMKIGTVAPSSPELASAMARQIPPGVAQGDGYVVELGGGTGPVTRAILKAGVPPDRLIVLERDPVGQVVDQVAAGQLGDQRPWVAGPVGGGVGHEPTR